MVPPGTDRCRVPGFAMCFEGHQGPTGLGVKGWGGVPVFVFLGAEMTWWYPAGWFSKRPSWFTLKALEEGGQSSDDAFPKGLSSRMLSFPKMNVN